MHRAYSLILLRLALVAFLATQAIVPAGFMPSAIKDGFGFSYCPGDVKNQAFIGYLSSSSEAAHHKHHRHHKHSPEQSTLSDTTSLAFDPTVESSSDSIATSSSDHCQFSIFSNVVSYVVDTPELSFKGLNLSPNRRAELFQLALPYFQPRSRAPPSRT